METECGRCATYLIGHWDWAGDDPDRVYYLLVVCWEHPGTINVFWVTFTQYNVNVFYDRLSSNETSEYCTCTKYIRKIVCLFLADCIVLAILNMWRLTYLIVFLNCIYKHKHNTSDPAMWTKCETERSPIYRFNREWMVGWRPSNGTIVHSHGHDRKSPFDRLHDVSIY